MVGIFALCLIGQTASTVSGEFRAVPLPELLRVIGTKVGKTVKIPNSLQNRAVTVCVRNRSAEDVLNAVALVVDGQFVKRGDDWAIELDSVRMKSMRDYVAGEDRLLASIADEKLVSLANLTIGKDPGNSPSATWAKERVGIDRYYAAGMWRRLNVSRLPGLISVPRAFRIAEPENEVVASFKGTWIDNDSARFAGTNIVLRLFPHTGELRVANLNNHRGDDGLLKVPYAFPAPPAELASTQFAKSLVDWRKPIEAIEESKSTPFEVVKPVLRRVCLADKLVAIHRKFGLDVVSDSFRIPSLVPQLPDGPRLSDCLTAIVKDEKLFSTMENRIWRVRHPGFWRLIATEPTMNSLAAIELAASKRALTLDDYANFSVANSFDIQTRFDHPDRVLVSFDITLLREVGPLLRIYGHLSPLQRSRLKAGETFDLRLLHNRPSGGGTDSIEMGDMAVLAPFYNSSIIGDQKVYFELRPGQVRYLLARGIRIGPGFRFGPSIAYAMGMSRDLQTGELRIFTGQDAANSIHWKLGIQ